MDTLCELTRVPEKSIGIIRQSGDDLCAATPVHLLEIAINDEEGTAFLYVALPQGFTPERVTNDIATARESTGIKPLHPIAAVEQLACLLASKGYRVISGPNEREGIEFLRPPHEELDRHMARANYTERLFILNLP